MTRLLLVIPMLVAACSSSDEASLDASPVSVDAGPDATEPAPDASPDADTDASIADAGTDGPTVASGHRMLPGEILPAGHSLTSVDGSTILHLDEVGNLILDNYNPGPSRLWQTYTWAPGGVLVLQPDGDLVLLTSTGRPVWSSQTANHPGAHVIVEFDLFTRGRVAIYSGTTELFERP
jgi:hypothetical protein